jgi:flagellar hook protein FlgE
MNISNNIASLQANQTFLNTSASNVANVNTDGFIPQDTRISNTGGTPTANTRVADNNGSLKSQTDLSKEIPDQIVSGGVAESNVSAIKTQDEMFGTLLDIKA